MRNSLQCLTTSCEASSLAQKEVLMCVVYITQRTGTHTHFICVYMYVRVYVCTYTRTYTRTSRNRASQTDSADLIWTPCHPPPPP